MKVNIVLLVQQVQKYAQLDSISLVLPKENALYVQKAIIVFSVKRNPVLQVTFAHEKDVTLNYDFKFNNNFFKS